MITFMFPEGVDQADVEKYLAACKRAQQEVDLRPEPYKHYFSDMIPERYRDKVDVRRFGVGERIVFLPYTQETFDRTQEWIQQRDIFEEVPMEESMLERVPLGTVPGADDATLEVQGYEDPEAQEDRQRGSSKVPFWAALWGWVRAGGRRTGAESVSRPGEKSQGASREDRSNRRSDPADGDTAP